MNNSPLCNIVIILFWLDTWLSQLFYSWYLIMGIINHMIISIIHIIGEDKLMSFFCLFVGKGPVAPTMSPGPGTTDIFRYHRPDLLIHPPTASHRLFFSLALASQLSNYTDLFDPLISYLFILIFMWFDLCICRFMVKGKKTHLLGHCIVV